MTYCEMFREYGGIDVQKATIESLATFCAQHNIPLYPGIKQEGIDSLLNLILGVHIEPQLGKDHLFVLTHYPASQAALAKKTTVGSFEAAERFEIYSKSLELANGYHELADAEEQRLRLEEANDTRQRLGKERLPIDTYFLDALSKGLPDCCGVAVGFDRCMMLRHGAATIAEVIPFDWERA